MVSEHHLVFCGVESVEKTASSPKNKAIKFRTFLIRFFHPPEKKKQLNMKIVFPKRKVRKDRFTLPETNIAPANRPGPERKGSSSNHPFSGAMLVSGRVYLQAPKWVIPFPSSLFIPP